MPRAPFAGRNLEPLTTLIGRQYGFKTTAARRHCAVFDEHLFRTQARRLPRVGRTRTYMADQEVWEIFKAVYAHYTSASARARGVSFEEAVRPCSVVSIRRCARWRK